MFDIGFPRDWSSLKKLIWLKAAISGGGASAVWKTVTGTLIHITDALASPMQKCEVTLEPIQDLHGQDAPYPAGGGKNKLETLGTTQTINDVTFTVNEDGSIKVNGTASALTIFQVNNNLKGYLQNGTNYILNGSPINSDTSKWKFRVYNNRDYIDNGNGVQFTFGSSYASHECEIVVYSGTTMNNVVFYPMIRLASVTDDTFAPYSNICPISGFTEAKIFIKDEYDASATPTKTISWQTEAGTVYGGTLTVNEDGSCDLSVEWRKEIYTSSLSPIASGQSSGLTWCTLEKVLTASEKAYAETPTAGDANGILNVGVWQRGSAGEKPRAFVTASLTSLQVVLISGTYDLRTAQGRTDYFANTLNGTNPEVCYKLKTPVTYHLESIAQITTLAGENNIWTDVNGEITIEYLAKG